MVDDQNLTYSKLTASPTRSVIISERDRTYGQSSRSYTDSELIQGKKNFLIRKIII
jgi:hypothetical protein